MLVCGTHIRSSREYFRSFMLVCGSVGFVDEQVLGMKRGYVEVV